MKRRILCLLLCLAMIAGLLPVFGVTPVHAATTSQNNIVARADYMYGLTWTAQSDVYGWNYETLFKAGETYRVPYGQPIYSGYYIGYGVEIDTFLTAANTPGSIYYTSRSTYNNWSSVYYATDCSAFVSWCWGVDRKTTYSLPFVSTDKGMANATNVYNLQLGDALNSNSVGHVVLVTDLTYDATGTLTQIEITEQTPPQLKRSYYTPAELAAKYGSAYSILRYSGTVPAAPEGSGATGTYLDSCTAYPAHCSIEVTLEGAPINSMPCSISEENGSASLGTANAGDIYTATALYQNGYGNYWYQITTSGGETGYIYGGEVRYLEDLTSDITITNHDIPHGHVAGNIFYVTGTISAQYNKLTNASVWIHKGFGTNGAKVTGYTASLSSNTYTLKGSAIDNNTAFNAVTSGNYTYIISASYTSYYTDGATTLKASSGTKNLAVEYFVVIPSAANQTTCAHSYATTNLSSATCTESGLELSSCSKCGLVNKTELPAADHSFGDWSTTVAATCTADGIQIRTCATCGHEETKTLTASGHTYHMVSHDATCTQHSYDEYTCSACGHSYKVYSGETSPWSETKPDNIPEERIETKTQYRYADYETTTSYDAVLDGYTLVSSDWDSGTAGTVTYVASWPSGFNTAHSTYTTYDQMASKVTASETETTKVTVESDAVEGYLWYHWCASGKTTSVANKTSVYSNFHAFYSTTSPAQADKHDTSDNSYKLSASTACTDCLWYWAIPVYAQKYTTQRILYTHGHWSDYSDWSDEAVAASDTRQVEERTVYRYIMTQLGDHIWNAGEVTAIPTCTAEGTKTFTCAECGGTRTEAIPVTGHSYTDGICSLCGEADPDHVAPVTLPTVTAPGRGLAFKDEIYYNVYFFIDNPDNVEITEMGLISWTSAIDGDIDNAEYVCPGAAPESDYYKTRSQSISAKNMGEQLYYKVYLKLADGSYVYSELKNYSAKDYCVNMLNNDSTAPAVKSLCVALMNYGAAAQEYFSYKTDDLMNAGLTAEQLALAASYSSDMIPALVDIGTKADGLAANGGFTGKAPNVSFGGAFGINYNFKPANTITGMKLYVWTEADTANLDTLSLENASQVIDATADSSGVWAARYSGIAAKNAGDTVYACGVYELDGVTYYSGILAYSVSAYCGNYAGKDGNQFQPLASAATVYTYYADAYLNG